MISILERIALECGQVLLDYRGRDMRAEDKDAEIGQHFSTVADRESQKLGLSIIRSTHPDVLVIAEEQENQKTIYPDCIVFDPLDGTTNYFNGIDDFGVTLCQFQDLMPVAAATFFPVRNVLISAVKGEGCYLGHFGAGKRYRSVIRKIPWHGRIDKTQIGTDIGSWTIKHGIFNQVLQPLSERFNILSSMSAIEGGRRILFGNTGAYFNLGVAKIWDAAAMALSIEEAGGVVSNPWGEKLTWGAIDCDWVFAVNQGMLEIVLEHSRQWAGR